MDQTVSISEAKDQLPRLIREVEAGAQVSLTRRGQPVARLVSEETYRKLLRRKRKIDWGSTLIDTRGFKFDREEANAR